MAAFRHSSLVFGKGIQRIAVVSLELQSISHYLHFLISKTAAAKCPEVHRLNQKLCGHVD
jgi:hypothetical protein